MFNWDGWGQEFDLTAMASSPHAAEISVAETLVLLDGPFSEMAEGVAQDRYAFWLGSGISSNRIPKTSALVIVVLDFLQKNASADPACPMRKSLTEILALAGVTGTELSKIDFGQAVKQWPDIEAIAQRLVLLYARVLDQAPDGKDPDYLVWNALDVVGVYADAKTEPDAEHFAIAALILEGVASDLPSANWDGLIEKAVDILSGGAPVLRVWVNGEDGRSPKRKADLYKFHGCAVLAGEDEKRYRERIVGRQSQINRWVSDNAVLSEKLIDIVTNKPTLMLGLSAQDANIQGIFATAQQRMHWGWPSHPPAYVFSENALGPDQQGLLQNVYRGFYSAANKPEIHASSLLRAFAKPLLAALWLHVLNAKLCALIGHAPGTLQASDQDELRKGLKALRDASANAAANAVNIETFLREAIARSRRVLVLLREGRTPTGGGAYAALTGGPVQDLAANPTLSTSGLAEFSVALGLLGLLTQSGSISVTVGDASTTALEVTSASGTSPILFAANAQAALHLFAEGLVGEDDDATLIHSHELTARMPRSPRRARGRTGRASLREASITELLTGSANAAELLQKFRQKVSL